MSKISISELIEFNPKRLLKRGAVAPFVDMAAISESDRDIQTISEREFKGGGSRFRNGDTLFARITPCLENGKTAKVNGLPDDVIGHGSTEFIVLAPKDDSTDEDYVYYLARLPEFRSYAQARMEGTSGRQRVSWQALSEFEVEFLPAKSRKKIGDILKKFDDKIQLNHQINQTLEQIAQALFKSWFVDFDPVKAKIEVLEAGGSEEEALIAAMQVISSKNAEELAAFEVEKPEEYAQLRATAELFPAAMVESELGEVPEGWEVGALADVADLNKNSWTKRNLPVEIEYVDLANTKNGIIELTTPYLSDEAPSRARRKLMDGDTIVGTVRPGNRSFAFIKKPSDILTGSTGFAVLSPKKKIYAEFIYIAATSDEAISRLAHLADGGAYPAVRSDVVSGLVTVIPEEEVLDYFHSLVSPFFELSERFHIESLTLKKLRDTLLPKLLSGEITFTEILLDEGGVNV